MVLSYTYTQRLWAPWLSRCIWFYQLLTGRSQKYVQFTDEVSIGQYSFECVPDGTILGPLLYIIMISDIIKQNLNFLLLFLLLPRFSTRIHKLQMHHQTGIWSKLFAMSFNIGTN